MGSPMNELAEYEDIMNRFRKAFAAADRELLAGLLGDEFEWHTHTFDPNHPISTGRVLRGVDEMVVELERRKRAWSNVRFEALNEYFAPKLITQSFTISGTDQGKKFEVAAVDLYTLDRMDRIVKKDTYWKHGGA